VKRFALGFVASIAISSTAAAQESALAQAPPPPPAAAQPATDAPPLPPWRFGLLPLLGGGFAAMTSGGTFPQFIGTTVSGLEIDAGYETLGLFGRASFFSSGQDGRWTGWSFSLGPTWRLFGDGYDRLGGIVRAGLMYERWSASNAGCDVLFFVPNQCKDFTPPPISGVVTAPQRPRVDIDAEGLGVLGGARIELPVHDFYLALDGELGVMTAFQSGAPGHVLEGRAALMFGFRHRRAKPPKEERFRPRPPRGSSY
jgi:hypothetical protein